MRRKVIDFLPAFVNLSIQKQKIKLPVLNQKVEILGYSTVFSGSGRYYEYESSEKNLCIRVSQNTSRITSIIRNCKTLYTDDYYQWLIDHASDYCSSGGCSQYSTDECMKALRFKKKPDCGRYYMLYKKLPSKREGIGVHYPKFKKMDWEIVKLITIRARF